MAPVFLMFLLCTGLTSVTSNNRTMSSFLFDITKDAMDLLPFLRQTPARSGDETVAATALNRLNNMLTNIRGSSDRYNILRSSENREGKGLMDRLTESLKPLLNPLKIVTTHVAGNNSRLAAALKKEEAKD